MIENFFDAFDQIEEDDHWNTCLILSHLRKSLNTELSTLFDYRPKQKFWKESRIKPRSFINFHFFWNWDHKFYLFSSSKGKTREICFRSNGSSLINQIETEPSIFRRYIFSLFYYSLNMKIQAWAFCLLLVSEPQHRTWNMFLEVGQYLPWNWILAWILINHATMINAINENVFNWLFNHKLIASSLLNFFLNVSPFRLGLWTVF